jgi:hypothetical protein
MALAFDPCYHSRKKKISDYLLAKDHGQVCDLSLIDGFEDGSSFLYDLKIGNRLAKGLHFAKECASKVSGNQGVCMFVGPK